MAEDGGADGLAGAVGHGAIPTGDRDERAGFTFAPAGETAGLHAHQERVLAAIADVAHLRDRQIKEIDSFNLHAITERADSARDASRKKANLIRFSGGWRRF